MTVFLGTGGAVLAFPEPGADLAGATALAKARGVREASCWALEPDDELGARLTALGFQDGWQPHWMGIDPPELRAEPVPPVEQSGECSRELPYWSDTHEHAVLPSARRRGYGRALTLAALARARHLGSASVSLNATAEGELLYRSVGFRSLGLGVTWWLFRR